MKKDTKETFTLVTRKWETVEWSTLTDREKALYHAGAEKSEENIGKGVLYFLGGCVVAAIIFIIIFKP